MQLDKETIPEKYLNYKCGYHTQSVFDIWQLFYMIQWF